MITTRAFPALFAAETTAILRSWLIRGWAAGAFIVAILPVLNASEQAEPISDVASGWLVVLFIPSAILAAVLGAGAITQDAEVAADSLLTRAVTRFDYLAAKLASRVAVVSIIHFGATLPMLFLAARWGADDSTVAGLIAASALTGVMLVFLTALGILTGAVLRSLAIAVVVIMIGFAAEGLIFGLFEIGVSPTRVLDELPLTIRGENSTAAELRVFLAFVAATVVASMAAAFAFNRREF